MTMYFIEYIFAKFVFIHRNARARTTDFKWQTYTNDNENWWINFNTMCCVCQSTSFLSVSYNNPLISLNDEKLQIFRNGEIKRKEKHSIDSIWCSTKIDDRFNYIMRNGSSGTYYTRKKNESTFPHKLFIFRVFFFFWLFSHEKEKNFGKRKEQVHQYWFYYGRWWVNWCENFGEMQSIKFLMSF